MHYMELRQGEKIVRVYHHHYFPYISRLFKVLIGAIPFFFLAYLFSPIMSMTAAVLTHISLVVFFVLVIIYVSVIYWLDRLVVTNQRIIYIDWKTLFLREECATNLGDVQDILSEERGIVSVVPFFNYGIVRIQTASHFVAITFSEAPNADAIKDFIYNLKRQVLTQE